eukprot:TRINITY_DN5824_c0_g1_i2.p2 TRINITY_DN5824_c0_g1~~TRINITY_DN5824_c0_g1_i2.p2  ORF type:complete len:124 (+),score=9.74 TRINITY_DN5824_c0_g1_i2:422-793(+)
MCTNTSKSVFQQLFPANHFVTYVRNPNQQLSQRSNQIFPRNKMKIRLLNFIDDKVVEVDVDEQFSVQELKTIVNQKFGFGYSNPEELGLMAPGARHMPNGVLKGWDIKAGDIIRVQSKYQHGQ